MNKEAHRIFSQQLSEEEIKVEQADSRLDHFLCSYFPQLGRRAVKAACKEEKILLNDKPVLPGQPLEVGDVLKIKGPLVAVAGGALVAPMALPNELILFEDRHLLVINKPRLIPSVRLHPGDQTTAADLLVAHCPECLDASPDRREGGLVNRLDTSTSGILIAAKSRSVWLALRESIAGEQFEKSYLAFVDRPPEPLAGTISAPLCIKRGAPLVEIATELTKSAQVFSAETAYQVVSTQEGRAIVRLSVASARRHQIRAHLAYLGAPLVGDKSYGSPSELSSVFEQCCGYQIEALELAGATVDCLPTAQKIETKAGAGQGFLLHAETATFLHPELLKKITISARSWHFDKLLRR